MSRVVCSFNRLGHDSWWPCESQCAAVSTQERIERVFRARFLSKIADFLSLDSHADFPLLFYISKSCVAMNTWEYYEYIYERLGQIDWMSWNWNSLLLPISIPSPHPSSWWGCHCHQAQISQRLHNIRKILQPGISTRHLTWTLHVIWWSMTSDKISTRQVGPDYTQELLEAAGVSRFPWRNEEVLLKHYIGNDPAPFFVEIVCLFFFCLLTAFDKDPPKWFFWGYPQVKPCFFHF